MNGIAGILLLIVFTFSSCIAVSPDSEQEAPDRTILVKPTHTNFLETPTGELTATSLPDVSECKMVIEEIASAAIAFTWAHQDDSLYFSRDPEMVTWAKYPSISNSVDLNTVFPVLQGRVLDEIDYMSPTIPSFSISPSGDKVIFWESAYTKPTPTPSIAEVPLTEFEWLLDFYLITKDSQSPNFITRVEGGLIDSYWSKDERFVYLLFDQIQIPGENFLVQLDLYQGEMKVILQKTKDQRFDNWIALSPDNNRLAFTYRSDSATVHVMNIDSGVIEEFSDLPEFDALFWANDDIWLLVTSSSSGSRFILFDYTGQEIVDTFRIDDRIGSLMGRMKPVLAPDGNKLAFFGSIDPKTNLPPLYILSLCE